MRTREEIEKDIEEELQKAIIRIAKKLSDRHDVTPETVRDIVNLKSSSTKKQPAHPEDYSFAGILAGKLVTSTHIRSRRFLRIARQFEATIDGISLSPRKAEALHRQIYRIKQEWRAEMNDFFLYMKFLSPLGIELCKLIELEKREMKT